MREVQGHVLHIGRPICYVGCGSQILSNNLYIGKKKVVLEGLRCLKGKTIQILNEKGKGV